jgi:hypothetical protein
VLYSALLALLYIVQRSLQYFPERRRTAPSTVGLSEVEEAVLDTADGERVIARNTPPRDGKAHFSLFSMAMAALCGGTSGSARSTPTAAGKWRLSYRGYGG